MNHPKWIHHCPPMPKNKVYIVQYLFASFYNKKIVLQVVGPVPPLKAGADKCKKKDPPKQESTKEKKPVKSPRQQQQQCKPQVPTSNWNTDGHLP